MTRNHNPNWGQEGSDPIEDINQIANEILSQRGIDFPRVDRIRKLKKALDAFQEVCREHNISIPSPFELRIGKARFRITMEDSEISDIASIYTETIADK